MAKIHELNRAGAETSSVTRPRAATASAVAVCFVGLALSACSGGSGDSPTKHPAEKSLSEDHHKSSGSDPSPTPVPTKGTFVGVAEIDDTHRVLLRAEVPATPPAEVVRVASKAHQSGWTFVKITVDNRQNEDGFEITQAGFAPASGRSVTLIGLNKVLLNWGQAISDEYGDGTAEVQRTFSIFHNYPKAVPKGEIGTMWVAGKDPLPKTTTQFLVLPFGKPDAALMHPKDQPRKLDGVPLSAFDFKDAMGS
jgi:hypothetical protein